MVKATRSQPGSTGRAPVKALSAQGNCSPEKSFVISWVEELRQKYCRLVTVMWCHL